MNFFFKSLLAGALASVSILYSSAQEKVNSDIISTPKFGGYIIGKYSYQDNDNTTTNGDGFNARLIRVYVDGSVLKDFKYRLQVEVNGDPGASKGPHIKDFYIEWAKYKEFTIRVGQFKRAFSFEDPYNPWDVGVGDYSLLVKKLTSMGTGDRCGEPSTGGRDQGIWFQGDLIPDKNDGHRYIHYQLGMYNGSGINHADNNKQKDFMGTIQVQPIKDLYIGAFGWTGTYGAQGYQVDRNRYAFGLKYEKDWTVRSEWAHSQGRKYDGKTVGGVGYDKADAFYATVGVPVSKLIKVYLKYDQYRDGKLDENKTAIYSISCNIRPHKNLMFQLQYNYVNDKTAIDTKYNQLWVETYIRW